MIHPACKGVIMRHFIFSVLCAIPILFVSCSPHDPSSPVTVFQGGILIDGTGQQALENSAVIVENGLVTYAGPLSDAPLPSRYNLIDCTGKTVTPGIINSHVHGGFDRGRLAAWLASGLTTIRNMSLWKVNMPRAEHRAFLQETRSSTSMASLVSSGDMITAPGGYGTAYAHDPKEAAELVQMTGDAGYDQVKISLEDGYAGQRNLPKMDELTLLAILASARDKNLPVSIHVTQGTYLQAIVNMGSPDLHVANIAHVPYDKVPQSVWTTMVDQGITMTPTFTIYRNFRVNLEPAMANTKAFHDAGGILSLGNDYAGGPGTFDEGIPEYEFRCLANCGISLVEIIRIATLNGAIVCGLDKTHGSLEKGKVADLLVLDGDLREDIGLITHVRQVFKHGIPVLQQ